VKKKKPDKLRVLICGDRNWGNNTMIENVIDNLIEEHGPIIIIHGDARGADRIAHMMAHKKGCEIRPFPAQWHIHGRAAGPLRNQQMLDEGNPSMVIAFHNDITNSKGTKDMVARAEKAGIPTVIIQEDWEDLGEEVQ